MKLLFSRKSVSPSLLFSGSFLLLILIGTFILKIPYLNNQPLAWIDALFMATSAVCVTGLSVLDVSQDLNQSGHYALLILVQLGGLGMLTFTSLFSFLLLGNHSFSHQLQLQYLTQSNALRNGFRRLYQVILITFIVEGIGVLVLYYLCQRNQLFDTDWESWHFSIFHSISAFCNAGFSTLPNSLASQGFEAIYSIHWVIAILFIFGGLGFSIMSNVINYITYNFKKFWSIYIRGHNIASKARIVRLETKLILITTLLLLSLGTLIIWFLEKPGTLSGYSAYAQLSKAFFTAATPRTAGFNTIPTESLATPTLLFIMFLMWLGASPGSTGGGIKTSTFAVALLNVKRIVQQKKNIVIGYRLIDANTVERAFSVIFLSIILICSTIFLLVIFEPELSPMALAFEGVSAYSTVGLSLGITSKLGTGGKLILIFAMFIGRTGIITLLISILPKQHYDYCEYPSEKILIN